jgi:N-acetylglutamate synthase-like GNAT family acetyltransferase
VSAPGYRVRRATTDDLDQLKALWAASALPQEELEKQFTDFQVAQSPEGVVAGAVAMQLAGSDGRIHSEVFVDFALSDTLRPLLWERLQAVARNHGLFRLWTEETALFWKKDAGFSAAAIPAPEAFAGARGPWLALRLKDESADPALLEAQFNLFREAERSRREKFLRWAGALKVAGTVLAALLLIFLLGALAWFIRHRPPAPR